MTPTDIGIYAFWLFIAVTFVRWLFAHNSKDPKGYREHINQLELEEAIRRAQADEQRRLHRFNNLREALLVESCNNNKDESKEIERLKAHNKKLMERINYIENKE